jgi:chromosome segregation ATPase
MLKRLHTHNFLAVRKKTIVFDPYVTCLVGKSAAGKSSLLRSLRWVTTNKPSGDGFINWDAKEAKVILWVDGKRIIRKKSKSKNLYKLGRQKLSSFKGDVPQPIAKLLNVGDVNFQTQHSLHFWFSNTPGEVGKQLNKIVNLDVIDRCVGSVAKKLRDCKSELSVHEKRILEHRRSLSLSRFAVEANKQLKHIEDLHNTQQGKTHQISILSELIGGCVKLHKSYEHLSELKIGGNLAMEAHRQAHRIEIQRKSLQNTLQNIGEMGDIVENRSTFLQKSKPIVKELGDVLGRLQSAQNKKAKLKQLIDEIVECQTQNTTA